MVGAVGHVVRNGSYERRDLPDGLHINQIYWLMREAERELQKVNLTFDVRSAIMRQIRFKHFYEVF